jgi:hypothetical protein
MIDPVEGFFIFGLELMVAILTMERPFFPNNTLNF